MTSRSLRTCSLGRSSRHSITLSRAVSRPPSSYTHAFGLRPMYTPTARRTCAGFARCRSMGRTRLWSRGTCHTTWSSWRRRSGRFPRSLSTSSLQPETTTSGFRGPMGRWTRLPSSTPLTACANGWETCTRRRSCFAPTAAPLGRVPDCGWCRSCRGMTIHSILRTSRRMSRIVPETCVRSPGPTSPCASGPPAYSGQETPSRAFTRLAWPRRSHSSTSPPSPR
mmetsp:Transcript_23875/g.77083  ORF Transcript_23875/g.77083 Transcript_23875/m.77083 type:complete len:224 (-) Transcript_23875:1724-2395(-)